jgi:hypothetical protein
MDLPYSTSTVFFKIGSNLDPFLFLQLNLEMRQAVTISFEPMIVVAVRSPLTNSSCSAEFRRGSNEYVCLK